MKILLATDEKGFAIRGFLSGTRAKKYLDEHPSHHLDDVLIDEEIDAKDSLGPPDHLVLSFTADVKIYVKPNYDVNNSVVTVKSQLKSLFGDAMVLTIAGWEVFDAAGRHIEQHLGDA